MTHLQYRRVSGLHQRFAACAVNLLIAVVLLGARPLAAHGQTVFDQNGFGAGRGTYSALPYEHVDPLSGNLMLVSTDLVLPGNAGLDITVQRVYNSAVYPNYKNGGDKTLVEDSWAGIGWTLHFGRVLNEDSTGSGETIVEMGDGSDHPLYTTTRFPAGWISKDFWVYNKVTHTLTMPNGRVYTFGRPVVIAGRGTVRYVTEIRDQFNNRLEFTYFTAGGPPDGVREIRQDLGAGQVRVVTFTASTDGLNALASMQFDDSIWTYGRAALGPTGYSALTSVQPPAGAKPWVYTYESTPGFVGLATMQAPSGGIVSYTYGDSTRTAGPTAPYYTQLSRVVTTRSIGGPSNVNITPGTWTFQYNQGPNKDQSIVDCPCGKTVYRYLGIGTDATGTFEAWRTGLLAERQVLDASNQVVEQETSTWERSEEISPDAVPGQGGIWTDPDVYTGLLKRSVLTRGPVNWTVERAYRTGQGTYNDFGLPFEITETGGGKTRLTRHTFWYGSLYIAGLIASTTVTLGAETFTMSATYDSTTAALGSNTVNGVTSSFDYYANGNPRTTWDGHNHQTTNTAYSWGVATETQTPLLTTSRQVSRAGLVTREQVGTFITDYTYDLAFRPLRVIPPSANPTIHSYDGLWDGWTRVERGSSQTHTVVDGFGRPISSVNEVQQKTLQRRDACGRVVFAALPYTNPVFATRGVETTYDVLGRVTKTRFTDGSPSGGPEVAETTYVYNGLDVTITDPLSRILTQEYAAIGGPGDAVLTAVVDAAAQRTTYTYDIANRLRTVGGAMPARSWTYDARGLLTRETHPESGATDYTYDTAGLLKTTTNAMGHVFTLTYDANDRLLTRDGPGTTSDVTLAYDTLGRLVTQQGANVTTTYEYDTSGRLSLRRDVLLGTTYESRYGYDLNDNLTSLTYPSGRAVGYTYDAENRLIGVTQNGTSFARNFVYDDSGALASYMTGAVTHRTDYDIRQRVARTTAGPGATPLDLTYAYNKGSQVTTITEPRFGAPQTFGYDPLNRMTEARGPWGTMQWTYDAAGNRLTEHHGGLLTFNYDAAKQRLTSLSTLIPGEPFTYDDVGRLTRDNRGTYTYTPGGMLASVTGTNLAATYTYDASASRVQRTVNGIETYTIRSASDQVLTEYESRCGSPVWTRDVVYAGSRALGAIKAPSDVPTVALTTSQSSIAETTAVDATVTVRLTTPTGAPLACAAMVTYRAASHAGEAARGYDFGGRFGRLTFPAGTLSGATQTISVPVSSDALDEGPERFSIDLSGATGATLGAASHIVTIVDDDDPPAVSIDSVTVGEADGPALFTVTLSAASARQIEVNYVTVSGTALADVDYATSAGRLIFLPGELTKPVTVPIANDDVAEPSETFRVQLSSPLNATLGVSAGHATILDNERSRAIIDTTMAGQYFPDVVISSDTSAYLLISNPHAFALTARLTFLRADASGVVQDVAIPAARRVTINLHDYSTLVGLGDVSLVVQSLNGTGLPLSAEVASYWQQDWRGGRISRGGTLPSSFVGFGEGAASSYFDEYLTVMNVGNEPVDITYALLTASGVTSYHTRRLNEWPGRVKLRVNDLFGSIEHGTHISATTPSGAPAKIVAERTMYWANGARNEGHSVVGTPAYSATWSFAEGAAGAYATFLALMNPTNVPVNVSVRYLHENGVQYPQTVSLPAFARATASPPPTVPGGGFAIHVSSPVAIVAERMIYSGVDWKLGDAALGAPALANKWHFAEGANSSFFDTWLLFGNPNSTASTVSLTFRTDAGAVHTASLTVPANGRATLDPASVPGLSSGVFATEVRVTNGVPIVAERAMYWPGSGWYAVHVTLGRPE